MGRAKKRCEICGKKTESLKVCKSCGRHYCSSCQSPSTTQDFCKECVAMEGVISKEE